VSTHSRMSKVAVYIDLRDWWVGYYKGPLGHYICLLPTVVIRIRRKQRWTATYGQ
jgi:hypothetical protein